jgi:hypothetical protein
MKTLSTLNLSKITSNFHTVDMCVTVDLQAVYRTSFVGTFMMYRRNTLHLSTSIDSSVFFLPSDLHFFTLFYGHYLGNSGEFRKQGKLFPVFN